MNNAYFLRQFIDDEFFDSNCTTQRYNLTREKKQGHTVKERKKIIVVILAFIYILSRRKKERNVKNNNRKIWFFYVK